MSLIEKLGEAIEEGDAQTAEELVNEGLASGETALKLLNEALIPAMNRVGDAFEEGDVFLPGVLMAAQAMKASMTILHPKLKEAGAKTRGTVILGTVQGDQHDIGKNLVGVLLEGAGFQVIDLGCDVADEKFVEAAKEHSANLIGMSALLNNTMTRMQKVIKALESAGIKDKVKVLVGGAPLDDEFASSIGADGYAPDGVSAVQQAIKLVE